MRKRQLLAATAALVATPFVTAPAWATTCATSTVGAYTGGSMAGCTYDGVTFSGLSISTTTTGSGTVTLGNITPFVTTVSGTQEIGLSLNYTAYTGTSGGTADLSWIYNASGNLLTDAFLSLTGSLSGGTASVDEQFTNGASLSLSAPGTSNVVTFTPISEVGVTKDQFDAAASGSFSETSILQDGFSLTTTPIPATLPLLATGLAGLWGVSRKRRKKGSRLGTAQAS